MKGFIMPRRQLHLFNDAGSRPPNHRRSGRAAASRRVFGEGLRIGLLHPQHPANPIQRGRSVNMQPGPSRADFVSQADIGLDCISVVGAGTAHRVPVMEGATAERGSRLQLD